VDNRIARLAERQIYLGTSSWKYEGWKGWFYTRAYKTKKSFNETCLSEYAEHYSAVGVDHTYYTWPNEAMFLRYAEQTPETFRFGLKATERVTVFRFPKLPRYGKEAGMLNTGFLDAGLFREMFLRPLDKVAHRLGPILLEFSQFYPGTVGSGSEFVDKLGAFLEALKDETAFEFAVEMRNSNWLKEPYFRCLSEKGASHVFNSWTRMPPLQDQMTLARPYPLRALVSRVLLQPGTKYAEAVEAFAPYDKVIEDQPELRQAVANLVLRAIELKLPAYVFVNNRAEGSAPRTIENVLVILEKLGVF
jgi:uncharacterized protein YecE (DUF72 family)